MKTYYAKTILEFKILVSGWNNEEEKEINK